MTFDAVMLFLFQSPLFPSFISSMMKEQKIYYLYHCNKQLNNKFVVCWSVLGACTDVSSPDDLFRLGVDVQGLDVLACKI